MLSFFRRKPKEPAPATEPWMYLGWSQLTYVDKDGKDESYNTIHFFARGEGLSDRKFEYVGMGKFDRWEGHRFVQQVVVPWTRGENLWAGITHPSEEFKAWTKENHAYEWKADKWVKPAPVRERLDDNVVKFPSVG